MQVLYRNSESTLQDNKAWRVVHSISTKPYIKIPENYKTEIKQTLRQRRIRSRSPAARLLEPRRVSRKSSRGKRSRREISFRTSAWPFGQCLHRVRSRTGRHASRNSDGHRDVRGRPFNLAAVSSAAHWSRLICELFGHKRMLNCPFAGVAQAHVCMK